MLKAGRLLLRYGRRIKIHNHSSSSCLAIGHITRSYKLDAYRVILPQSLRCIHKSTKFASEFDSHWSESVSSDESLNCSDSVPRPSTMEDVQRALFLLQEAISYCEKNTSSWLIENKIKLFVQSYNCLTKPHKEGIIKTLATKYSVNQDNISSTLKKIKDLGEGTPLSINDERQLKSVLTPLYIWLFKTIGRLENGVKFLVDLRRDMLDMLHHTNRQNEEYLPLRQLNSHLKDLLTLWFSVGFFKLERITWKSSCEMLQKISEYEAVHPVRSWTDLKRRVGPYRRCFVFVHSSMPSEPIVVLHTALCKEIASSTKGIVAATQQISVESHAWAELTNESHQVEDPDKISTAIFYSITSTQLGLQGIELGNYLIKRVAQELLGEFPRLANFSTLSPIPTFKFWLFEKFNSIEKGENHSFFRELWAPVVEAVGGWKDLRKKIHNNSWINDPQLLLSLEGPLMSTCAHYLYKEKKLGMALDNVANFHLKNGAVMWRLNWLADTSARGLTNSCGLMVNYKYVLKDTERNSRLYLENMTINASDHIKLLIGETILSKM